MITNKQLRATFLTPNMKYYFDKKLSHLCSEEVDVQIEELLKYLNMAVYCNGDIPFSKEIDEVWHYWILETSEYQVLCDKLHGRGFFHHTSNDYTEFTDKEVKARKPDLQRNLDILASYVLNYGDFQEDRVRYWPMAKRLLEMFDWTVIELNVWLHSCIEGAEPVQLASTQ
jgi:hypothetical protein